MSFLAFRHIKNINFKNISRLSNFSCFILCLIILIYWFYVFYFVDYKKINENIKMYNVDNENDSKIIRGLRVGCKNKEDFF